MQTSHGSWNDLQSHTLDSTRYRSSKGLLLKSPDCPLAWVQHDTPNGTLLVMLKADNDI